MVASCLEPRPALIGPEIIQLRASIMGRLALWSILGLRCDLLMYWCGPYFHFKYATSHARRLVEVTDVGS